MRARALPHDRDRASRDCTGIDYYSSPVPAPAPATATASTIAVSGREEDERESLGEPYRTNNIDVVVFSARYFQHQRWARSSVVRR